MAEGGQGLIHLQSEILAMWIQTLQKLLYSSNDVPCVFFGRSILKDIGGIGIDKQLFLMQRSFVKMFSDLSCSFYVSVLKSWELFEISRTVDEHYGVEEPLFLILLFSFHQMYLSQYSIDFF